MGAACSSEDHQDPISTVPCPADQALTQERDMKDHSETEHAPEDAQSQLEEEKDDDEDEAERKDREEAELRREAEERRLQEEKRLAEEKAAKKAEEAAQRQREHEEQRAEQERAAAEAQRMKQKNEEARRAQLEQEKRAEDEKAAAAKTKEMQAADKKKLDGYLTTKGFTSLNGPKKAGFKQKQYALHQAVKENDLDMVKHMIKMNANCTVKSKSGKIPLEKAQKYQQRDPKYKDMVILLQGLANTK